MSWVSDTAVTLLNMGCEVVVNTSLEYSQCFEKPIVVEECFYNYLSFSLNDIGKYFLLDYSEGILITSLKYVEYYCNNAINADLIVYDSMAYWGKLVSERLAIPSISIITNQPYVFENMINDNYRLFNSYKSVFNSDDEFYRLMHIGELINISKYDLPESFKWTDIFCSLGNNNIILSGKQLCKYQIDIDNTYYCMPPMRLQSEKQLMKKGIYISFGSIVSDALLIERIIELLIPLNEYLYVNSGSFTCYLKHKYPFVNFYEFAPQIDLLQRCKVFITHGGMNSIREAIGAGIPLVVIPLVNDQFVNAEMVEENGFGILVDYKSDDFDNSLIECINKVITNSHYINNIRAAAQQLNYNYSFLLRKIINNLNWSAE